jgi:integrase
MKINTDQPAVPDERFGVVLERYVQEEIPKRFSTKHAYLSYINNHIRPKWGEFPLTQVKPLAVRDWLKGIQDKKGRRPLASKTRGHIKGLMHRIFDCAMLWEYLPPDRNPMSLVRIEGSSKRRRKPRILTPEEFSVLVAAVDWEPVPHHGDPGPLYRREMFRTGCLKWSDLDW